MLCRFPRLAQSLWYDEMYTLVEYVVQPWHKILAANPGEYVPNNHVLHTILCKLVYTAGAKFGWCRDDGILPFEALLRMPSFIAGVLLPLAVAWPLRKSQPRVAFLLGAIVTMNPWLIAFSTEARGYSLILLFAAIATNLLPDGFKRWPIAYATMLISAIYTVPIAVVLIPAHILASFVLHRREQRQPLLDAWLKVLIIVIPVCALLYLPMARAMFTYYSHPFETTITRGQLLDQLPRYALAGENLPRYSSRFGHVYFALPVLIFIFGTACAIRQKSLHRPLVAFAITSAFGLALALISSHATEVRFVPWIGIWLCIALAGILTSADRGWLKHISTVGMIVTLAWMGLRDIQMLPSQQIKAAMIQADALSDRPVMMLYLGARESAYLYGPLLSHPLAAAHDMPRFEQMETQILADTGSRPTIVLPYERLAKQRDIGEPDSAGLWTHLTDHYTCVMRLPGRVSDVAIYVPRDAPIKPIARAD